jgi:hypothetical protein
MLGGIVLEDLEAVFQLGLCLAEAVQTTEHVGAAHPSGSEVFCRTPQRSLYLQDGINAVQGGFPALLFHLS